MRGPRAGRIHLAPPVRRELEAIVRSGSCGQWVALRARMILLAAGGHGTRSIALELGCSERLVRKWRRRFALEPCADTIYDLPRAGRPPVIPVQVRCELVKLACERRADEGAPFRDVWTQESLREALKAETGWDVSRSEIGRTLRIEEIRPHRVRYWLHSQDPDFRSKVARICDLYQSPGEERTVLCIDEKTCMQALDRRRRLTKPRKKRDSRFEYEYRRRGTMALLGAFEVRTGRVFGRCGATRKAQDLLDFMDEVAAHFPGKIVVIWDNLNIHKGDRWKEFNRKHGGRFEFVYTPVHASWVNQIEIWFGILQRRVLRLGVFRSTAELTTRVMGFIDHWNEKEAHPFRWTFRIKRSTMKRRRRAG